VGAAIGSGLQGILGLGAGVGGIDRGGSSTGLLWGEAAGHQREGFQPRLLTPSRFLDLESSSAVGLAADAPEVAPSEEGAGLVDVETSPGKASWHRRLSPRHRDAVRTFFSKNQRESK